MSSIRGKFSAKIERAGGVELQKRYPWDVGAGVVVLLFMVWVHTTLIAQLANKNIASVFHEIAMHALGLIAREHLGVGLPRTRLPLLGPPPSAIWKAVWPARASSDTYDRITKDLPPDPITGESINFALQAQLGAGVRYDESLACLSLLVIAATAGLEVMFRVWPVAIK